MSIYEARFSPQSLSTLSRLHSSLSAALFNFKAYTKLIATSSKHFNSLINIDSQLRDIISSSTLSLSSCSPSQPLSYMTLPPTTIDLLSVLSPSLPSTLIVKLLRTRHTLLHKLRSTLHDLNQRFTKLPVKLSSLSSELKLSLSSSSSFSPESSYEQNAGNFITSAVVTTVNYLTILTQAVKQDYQLKWNILNVQIPEIDPSQLDEDSKMMLKKLQSQWSNEAVVDPNIEEEIEDTVDLWKSILATRSG